MARPALPAVDRRRAAAAERIRSSRRRSRRWAASGRASGEAAGGSAARRDPRGHRAGRRGGDPGAARGRRLADADVRRRVERRLRHLHLGPAAADHPARRPRSPGPAASVPTCSRPGAETPDPLASARCRRRTGRQGCGGSTNCPRRGRKGEIVAFDCHFEPPAPAEMTILQQRYRGVQIPEVCVGPSGPVREPALRRFVRRRLAQPAVGRTEDGPRRPAGPAFPTPGIDSRRNEYGSAQSADPFGSGYRRASPVARRETANEKGQRRMTLPQSIRDRCRS